MDFVSNREQQLKEMLSAIGVKSVDELFSDIPKSLLMTRPTVDDGISEFEGLRLMESLSSKNSYLQFDSYLGAGAYEHHVPALVGMVCSKSEFLTSYTPYQAEISQGLLQAIFEYQSSLCALTDMDASNASVYDGGFACAEAVLMALRYNKDKNKILIAESLNPLYRKVVDQYLGNRGFEVIELKALPDGSLDLAKSIEALDANVAAILLQSPNFFGIIENIKPLSAKAKEHGALTILCSNPLSFGLFLTPGELGVDIAVGDCQPFGIPLQYGGPYLGYIACQQDLIRQIPGRLVGETKDSQGRRGYVLTLQAREQHIRREKATSNICTNQALAALASLVAISWYGPDGIKQLALTNFQRTAYLKSELSKINGCKIACKGDHFNEFEVTFDKPIEKVLEHFRSHKIEPGFPLKRFYPSREKSLLVAVTETKNENQLEKYLDVARSLS